MRPRIDAPTIAPFVAPRTGGALLVAGTSSDAGKSLITAGLCKMLTRKGFRVAPFKAQNMSNNSAVASEGGEMGRAQALQAYACGLEPSVRFNPILLKPGSDRRSQLVVRGQVAGTVGARDYFTKRGELREVVARELASLRSEYDVVICEGAGSPAEINLRATDIANMGLAEMGDLPVVIVGDIDRGGVFAHLFGTIAIMAPEDQQRVAGFIINKFRGDATLLKSGLDDLLQRTGREVLGVLPFIDRLELDVEDSLSIVPALTDRSRTDRTHLNVAAIRLPRISNSTDVAALAAEPGVEVTWADEPGQIASADFVVVPGSKSTIDDLRWLRETGLADALVNRAALGNPILAICGGYQMLARSITDAVESAVGTVEGLGLFDCDVVFEADKVTANVTGTVNGCAVSGYEIHHGRVRRSGDAPLLVDSRGFGEGSVRDGLWGTHWHGLLDNDDFRRELLMQVAQRCGRDDFEVSADTSIRRRRDDQLNALADVIADQIDVEALLKLMQLT